jgi:MFS family permease
VFCLDGLGPILVFLHDELRLSYTLTSLHSALWAAGTVLSGLVFARLTRLAGRARVFWWSMAGTAAGALLFAVGHVVALTLLAAAWLGTAGTVLQTSTSAVLADRHGPLRKRALVEANIGASAIALVAPVLLGLAQRGGAGWRLAMLVPVAALGLVYLCYRGQPLPAPPRQRHGGPGRLPAASGCTRCSWRWWSAWSSAWCSTARRYCTPGRAWTPPEAAAAMGLFVAGELTGRVAGGRLTRRPGRARALVLGALTVTAGGFALLWLADRPLVAQVGLTATGLGVANLYPLGLALALAAAPGRTDQAAGRTQLLVGAAVGLAPFALGALADAVGVRGRSQ